MISVWEWNMHFTDVLDQVARQNIKLRASAPDVIGPA